MEVYSSMNCKVDIIVLFQTARRENLRMIMITKATREEGMKGAVLTSESCSRVRYVPM